MVAGFCRDNVERPSEWPVFGDRFDQRKAMKNIVNSAKQSNNAWERRGTEQGGLQDLAKVLKPPLVHTNVQF